MRPFVHLHVHSEYSLLDGICRIDELAVKAKELGQQSIAITDHGNLYGAVAFWRACKNAGIKPIIGCEVYVAARSRFEKEGKTDASGDHLILLVENETGYHNLMQLVSRSFTEGFYSKPRIDFELLAQYHEGLIALSACLSGFIAAHIVEGQMDEARAYAQRLSSIFGANHFYLELQNHGLADDMRVCAGLRTLSKQTGIPLVVTNDVHYLRKSDANIQHVVTCIQTNTSVAEEKRFGLLTNEFYLKTGDEMVAVFPEDVEALDMTCIIADRCRFDFVFGQLHMPTFPPVNGQTHSETLAKETENGFLKRISEASIVFDEMYTEATYRERIMYELSVIDRMGFDEYFLIVQDFVRYAKTHDIPVGPGRGSGAGSLVAFCLGITDVDPLRYDLLFERFLNPERISLPDFDIDFCYEKRDRVISYVKGKYGEDHVAQIITFGTLQAKAAIRDVGRVMGVTFSDTDRVVKLIPSLGFTISDAMTIPAFRQIYEESQEMTDLIDTARAIEGLPRHISVHAAGVVITEKPVSEYVPLAVSGEAAVAAFDMNTVAELGLVKFDFLGLRYLTVLADAEKLVREFCPEFSLDKISFTDQTTYRLLCAGKTEGVFQLESNGIRNVLIQLKPTCIDDIIACIALYRPGPMESIDTFIARKSGKEPINYMVPALASILDKTYGCIVYQEQVMQIFRLMGGYSYAQADLVRRAISKKKEEVLNAERGAFITGAEKRGYSAGAAQVVFDEMASFAKYAFNKSHATAYAFISYRTAYMKAHYPEAYAAALLNAQQDTDLNKCPVRLLPPDINRSREKFSVEGNAVRFGFSSLKNIGRMFAEAIVATRGKSSFSSFADFLERMPTKELNKRAIETLIRCGAFDSFGYTRAGLCAVYEDMIDDVLNKERANITGQLDLFSLVEHHFENNVTGTRQIPNKPEFCLAELLLMEKELAGICFSGNLLDDYSLHISDLNLPKILSALEGENEAVDGETVKVCGVITTKSIKKTKKGATMAFIIVEDQTASVEMIAFPKVYEQYYHLLEIEQGILAEGYVQRREAEKPTIILKRVEALKTNSMVSSGKTEQHLPKNETPRLILRVPSMACVEMTQTLTLLNCYRGPFDVVFYDVSQKKYHRAGDIRVSEEDSLVVQLKKILGDSSVVWQNKPNAYT